MMSIDFMFLFFRFYTHGVIFWVQGTLPTKQTEQLQVWYEL